MYIYMDDPHPGRCPNLRYSQATHEYVRCLDYAGKPHTCTFPAPMVLHTKDPYYSSSITKTTKPTPWVKPGEEKKLEPPKVDLSKRPEQFRPFDLIKKHEWQSVYSQLTYLLRTGLLSKNEFPHLYSAVEKMQTPEFIEWQAELIRWYTSGKESDS